MKVEFREERKKRTEPESVLVFVDVSFGDKGKMKGSTKSGKWLSPWRYKKATEIMSVLCSLKLKQCGAHFVWPLSPLPLAKGERTKVRGWSPTTVGCPQ